MERKPTGKKYNDEFKKIIVDLYHAGKSGTDERNPTNSFEK
ncbi:hypothetical protein [Priestia megaterium]